MPKKSYKQTKDHREKHSKTMRSPDYEHPMKRPEVRAKFIGNKNPMYGVHLIGDKNPMYGKHHSQKTKNKISETKKNFFIQHPEAKKTGNKHFMYGKMGDKSPHWKGGKEMYWRRKSRRAWESYHGRKIPKGHIIHHKDRDITNISHENLILMSSISYHNYWHRMLTRLVKIIFPENFQKKKGGQKNEKI
jgi:hypothetical protein